LEPGDRTDHQRVFRPFVRDVGERLPVARQRRRRAGYHRHAPRRQIDDGERRRRPQPRLALFSRPTCPTSLSFPPCPTPPAPPPLPARRDVAGFRRGLTEGITYTSAAPPASTIGGLFSPPASTASVGPSSPSPIA